ncbi:hypothetical protein CAAU_2717 [Caloramator australicus RC3]|uniref:Uncharacterized protein n=1 Tax=Caloramator australicus RC3 TaxID=857293 RepID=I7LKY1_9CLOT|nr:hypothetical protein CAAU_2717 [Caloramator australicus RC3]
MDYVGCKFASLNMLDPLATSFYMDYVGCKSRKIVNKTYKPSVLYGLCGM